jgi:hypothetical protein
MHDAAIMCRSLDGALISQLRALEESMMWTLAKVCDLRRQRA